MKAVVLQVDGKKATILGRDGIISQIANNGYSIGDELSIKLLETKGKGRITSITSYLGKNAMRVAAAALVMVVGISGVTVYAMPAATVTVDINPSLEYKVNLFNRVVSVSSYNDDGEVLFNSVRSGITYKKLDAAVDITLDALEEAQYISEGTSVVITVDSKLTDTQKIEDSVMNTMNDWNTRKQNEGKKVSVAAEAVTVTDEMRKAAKEKNESPGKIYLEEKLEAASVNDSGSDQKGNTETTAPGEVNPTTALATASPVTATPTEASGASGTNSSQSNAGNGSSEQASAGSGNSSGSQSSSSSDAAKKTAKSETGTDIDSAMIASAVAASNSASSNTGSNTTSSSGESSSTGGSSSSKGSNSSGGSSSKTTATPTAVPTQTPAATTEPATPVEPTPVPTTIIQVPVELPDGTIVFIPTIGTPVPTETPTETPTATPTETPVADPTEVIVAVPTETPVAPTTDPVPTEVTVQPEVTSPEESSSPDPSSQEVPTVDYASENTGSSGESEAPVESYSGTDETSGSD